MNPGTPEMKNCWLCWDLRTCKLLRVTFHQRRTNKKKKKEETVDERKETDIGECGEGER